MSNNYYGNPYAQGGFRAIETGMEYLMNRDRLAQQAESDRIRSRNEMAKAEMDDKYRSAALDVEKNNLSRLADNDLLEITSRHKADMARISAELAASTKATDAQLRLGLAQDATRRVEVDSVAAVNNATAAQTNAQTAMEFDDNENKNAAKVMNQLDVLVMDKYDDDWDKAGQDPLVKETLRVVVGSAPSTVLAANEQHRLTTLENPLKEVGNSGNYAVVGISDVNGKPTVGTARNEVTAEGGTDGAVNYDLDVMRAQAYAKAVKGGYISESALNLLTAKEEETGLTVDQMADSRLVHSLLKENTADAPTNEQVAAMANQTGIPLRSAGNDAQAAAADPVTAPPPAAAPQATTTQPDGFRQRLTAMKAIHASDPDRITDFASGRGYNQAEANQSRAEEAADNAAARAELKAKREAEREERKELMSFRRQNPNADITGPTEREKLLEEQRETVRKLGVNDAFNTFDFGKEISILDKPAEGWLAPGTSTKDREDYAYEDVKTTVTNNKEQFEKALGVPYTKWGRAEWRKAAEITKLSRKDDTDNAWWQNDTNSFGTLNENAIREFKQGKILNTRENK